jgi:hypothetical protein
VAEGRRKVQALRERLKSVEDIREARGISLLREWLSTEQQAQFDASKSFEVIGCDSGKRYRILCGNVHELDEAGQSIMGFCFVPFGGLVAGDVMLAQRITLHWLWTTDFPFKIAAEQIRPPFPGAGISLEGVVPRFLRRR